MANSKISDLSNTVAAGDNVIESMIAGEASLKAGMGVYGEANGSGVKMIEGNQAMASGLKGVVKEHYATGIDSALSNAQSIEVVTQGIVPVFVDDPGKDVGAGAGLHLSGATAGSFGWNLDKDFVALSGFQNIARTIRKTSNGDTVTWARIL